MISAHLGNSQFRGTVLADVESFDSPPRGSQSYHRGRQPGHVSVGEGEGGTYLLSILHYQTDRFHQVGGRAVGYYMGTTVLAVVTGIILVTTIHPGVVGQDKVGFRISRLVLTGISISGQCPLDTNVSYLISPFHYFSVLVKHHHHQYQYHQKTAVWYRELGIKVFF